MHRMTGRNSALFLATLTLVFGAPRALAEDWPCFRGPRYDGISREKDFRADWDKTPPRVWEREIGSGFSAFACVGDKVYTCGTADKKQVLFCLNADTGAPVWQANIEDEYAEKSGGDGPRGTPTVHDGLVYVQGAKGRLLCCDAATGKEAWSIAFNAPPRWGYSNSILIVGDLALTQAGGDHQAVVALDRKTGKVAWESGGKAPPGYGTPYPFTFDGKNYVAVFLAKKVLFIDPKDGREAGDIPWVTDYDVNAAQPLFHDGDLFVSSGYKTGSAVFKLKTTGDQLEAEKVWGADKVILGKFQSACLWDGKLYVADQNALKCVDFMTGKELWKDRDFKEGSSVMLAGDGEVLAFTAEGELEIGKASPDKWTPTAKVELLTGRCWTVPTLYQGKVYVRNLKSAACYKLAK